LGAVLARRFFWIVLAAVRFALPPFVDLSDFACLVSEDELAAIARAGYAEAASTDRKGREAAVSVFLSDAVWGLMQ
jgi:hypothetical protein